jgi:hypothetical protein
LKKTTRAIKDEINSCSWLNEIDSYDVESCTWLNELDSCDINDCTNEAAEINDVLTSWKTDESGKLHLCRKCKQEEEY